MVGARGLTPTSKTILVRFKNLLKNVPPRCTRVVRSMCSRRTYRCLALRPWKPPRFGPSVSPSANDPMPAAVPGSGHTRCLRTCGARGYACGVRRLEDHGVECNGFRVKSRWSHLRDVRARRPTLRGRTISRTCSMVRFAVDGLFVPCLNDRSTTAPRTLHGNLPGHGSIKARWHRMLQPPGDADRATAGVADVLARPEEVVRCR